MMINGPQTVSLSLLKTPAPYAAAAAALGWLTDPNAPVGSAEAAATANFAVQVSLAAEQVSGTRAAVAGNPVKPGRREPFRRIRRHRHLDPEPEPAKPPAADTVELSALALAAAQQLQQNT